MKYNLMAKTKSKNQKNVVKNKKSRVQKAPKMNQLQQDMMAIARHISDPCNSDLSASGLPGQKGIVSRFVSETNFEMLSGTSLSITYCPATSSYSADATVGSGNTFTPNILGIGGPGTSFLGGSNPVANAFRPLGACIEVMNYTPTVSRGGMWAFLHTPTASVYNSLTNVDNQFASANERGTWGDGSPVQALWRPGYLDDTYGTWDDSRNEVTDFTDRNSITFACMAGAERQDIRVRITLVCEWVPPGA